MGGKSYGLLASTRTCNFDLCRLDLFRVAVGMWGCSEHPLMQPLKSQASRLWLLADQS